MRSFNIAERDFKVECTESPNEKFYAVYHPRKKMKRLLGYMRFSYDAMKLGSLEITNFKASLQRRHLGIGGTTKADDIQQMGQYGEGLKLSALVNRRHPHNYSFTIHSSGCKWFFGWNSDKKLICKIQRIPRAHLTEQKELAAEQDEQGKPRQAQGRDWEDVSVFIGEPRRCRSLKGEVITTSKVPLEEFEKWLSMTIDINGPTDVVRTKYGDLILDPKFENKIYIHGLQLPNGSKSGKKFKFGYNLLYAATGRDRDTTADADEEAGEISEIWDSVLTEETKIEDPRQCLAKYTVLLREHFHNAADVFNIEKHIDEEVTHLVWEEMLKEKKNGRPVFFYEAGGDPRVRNLSGASISMDVD